MLKIFNSLTNQKQDFKPLAPGTVKIYVCGMTVYDLCHIGHARVMIVFDMVVRYLRMQGFSVHYVRNITDIDDKIIQRAKVRNIPIAELTQEFTQAMHKDAAALNIMPPDEEPRATEHIDKMIAMIAQLIANKSAYVAANGDVFYDVSTFKAYGQLSGKQLAELRAGARVDIQDHKTDPLDFVLWKSKKPGEPSWPTPWGEGRPGWHIECSAMAMHYLGEHFDIHGGGHDLQFPHHENEIAQSEAVTGKPFVNIWMHNGFVQVAEEKMSKSLGNFFTVREVLQQYHPEVVRFFILSSHYRSPLNYTTANLDIAKSALTKLYLALRDSDYELQTYLSINQQKLYRRIEQTEPNDSFRRFFIKEFEAAMNDDFNTPKAITWLHEVAKILNDKAEAYRIYKRHKDSFPAPEPPDERTIADHLQAIILLKDLGSFLGLMQYSTEEFLQAEATDTIDTAMIERLIEQRKLARATKDYARADAIRGELAAHGIQLEDTQHKTIWRQA